MTTPKRIVLTGGPGAGKTAVLEMARGHFCSHVAVLPEAASVVFGGGFPRHTDPVRRAAAQRAIYHVQDELEHVALATAGVEVVLCDRGTLDALAYWPAPWETFFADLHTTLEEELRRYDIVIHLRTPTRRNGYHKDALRIEPAKEAEAIDERLLEVWKDHPHRVIVDSTTSFLDKAKRTLGIITELLPADCLPAQTTA